MSENQPDQVTAGTTEDPNAWFADARSKHEREGAKYHRFTREAKTTKSGVNKPTGNVLLESWRDRRACQFAPEERAWPEEES